MGRQAYFVTLFVIAVALAASGVASLWRYVGFRGLVANDRWIVVEINEGNVIVGHARFVDHTCARRVNYLPLGFLGRVVVASGTWRGNWKYIGLTLPLWSVVALLFLHPAVAFARGPLRRHRRRRRNECIKCGYERTGNTSGICPECGSVLSRQTC
ncbi:MAG: hypothetical protein ACE5HE_01955 [Phycisphaerae bacterium]